MLMMRVTIDAKNFADRQVLRGIDFALGEGEVLAVVGRSRCRQDDALATDCRARPRLRREDRCRGADRHGVPGAATVAVAPHHRECRPRSPRLATPAGQCAAGRRALAQVGLAGEADTFPRALSGGMARRVALARALVIRPRLMLLDEPFASLDEATADQLRQMVAELWQQHRVSVVLVTHDVRKH